MPASQDVEQRLEPSDIDLKALFEIQCFLGWHILKLADHEEIPLSRQREVEVTEPSGERRLNRSLMCEWSVVGANPNR